jgi:plasmid stabilization system protein ParE
LSGKALEVAERRIAGHPEAGLSAPRPYPKLARPGRAWIKAGRYWIAYRTKAPLLIVAVFYETANIPGRL